MLGIKSFNGGPACIMKEEIGISNKKERNFFLKTNIVQNIVADHFHPLMIETVIDLPEYGTRMARSHDFVAIKQKNSLSLWQVSFGRELWKCSTTGKKKLDLGLIHEELLVDKKGVIAQISRQPIYINSHKTFIEIFCDGKKTGSNLFDSFIDEIQIIKGHLYGIGIEPQIDPSGHAEFKSEKLNLYKLDITGKVVCKVSLADLKENSKLNIVSNEDYFIICATYPVSPDFPSKVFIFDCASQFYKCMALEKFSAESLINSLFSFENYLIVGSCKRKMNLVRCNKIQETIYSHSNPEISIYNLFTGKIEKRYLIEKQDENITHLITNKDFIFFVLSGQTLWSLELSTGIQTKIIKIDYNLDVEMKLQLSLTGNLLTLCYPTGFVHENKARHVRTVIDINTNSLIQQIEYLRYPWTNMTFESGCLVIPKTSEHQLDFYIENFSSSYIEEQHPIFRTRNLLNQNDSSDSR